MKKLMQLAVLAILLTACGKPKGELIGAGAKGSFHEAQPYGMVFIKQGSFMMGVNNQTTIFSVPDKQVKVSVSAFWMDETEITNDEYKQFTNWVRDSIARTLLIQQAGLTEYAKPDRTGEIDEEHPVLNWKTKIPWDTQDEEILSALDQMRDYDGSVDPNVMHYRYEWLNLDQAALPKNRCDPKRGCFGPNAEVRVDTSWVEPFGNDHLRGEIKDSTLVRKLVEKKDLLSSRIVNVYPDTIVWIRDFQFAYNEPLLSMYFCHPGYAHYPIVGVTWEQAEAFCHWRTEMFNQNHEISGQLYRLPTEAEWEYAARGGRKMALYPWGGNYVRDNKGCYLANFKPMRGSYTDDTGAVTMHVASFAPNDFGLFDMAGNVSEWTCDAFNPSSNKWIHDMNSSFQYNANAEDPAILKRKVIKGGSWKDVAYYLQCGTRTYEYQFEDRAYIGFRCVRSFMGE